MMQTNHFKTILSKSYTAVRPSVVNINPGYKLRVAAEWRKITDDLRSLTTFKD